MQLFGWTLHSCWMLLTVISVCCCVDIGSSTDINDEVMEDQPWIWNDFKLAGTLRSKFHSMMNEAEEDNDNTATSDEMDKTANPVSAVAAKRAMNYREHHQRGQHRMEPTADNPNEEDFYYDVESRPYINQGRHLFNIKPNDKKRSHNHDAPQLMSRRQQQQSQGTSISSPSSSLTADDVDSPSSLPVIASDVEPRVLPLLGFHAAINKISRPKEALLKKILRQAARRQSMKRSPNCMRKCIAQGLLHPAQCHSLC